MPIRRFSASTAGFSLVETLVSVAIIATLAGLAYGGYQAAMSSASKMREISAAKSLITAYSCATEERSGELLPGYDRTVNSVVQPDGSVISGPPAQRYPFRITPYLQDTLDNTILVGNNAHQVDRSSDYTVSLCPALGMNTLLVGGEIESDGTNRFQEECASRPSHLTSPLLVFASACTEINGERIEGYNKLDAPHLWGPAQWTPESSPDAFGHVDARHGGKAVCAFSDGSVQMLAIEELRDMRLWSKNAAAQGNANHVPRPSSSGSGRR